MLSLLSRMNIHNGLVLLLFVTWYGFTEPQNIDSLGPAIHTFVDISNRNSGSSSDDSQDLLLIERMHKLQPSIKDNVAFPCSLNNTRSNRRPESVHLLRPGDVDIIGAIGDSLTAGQALLAISPAQILSQARGLSFSGGGQGTWSNFLTLPNILKEFNPKLIGYAKSDSSLYQNDSQFNVAEAAALIKDMPYMARILITRMESDTRVNIKTNWKMVTIYLGSFDFCVDACYNREDLPGRYRRKLTAALKMLKYYLPRTIVNLILPLDPRSMSDRTTLNEPSICRTVHNYGCPCIFNVKFQKQQDQLHNIWIKLHQVAVGVIKESEFDTEDFTVVLQPGNLQYRVPKTDDGLTDYSYVSGDCIHMSQKENARAALSLWNNILEPIGEKSEKPSDLYNFKCPTADHPYIFTRRNSQY